ncbi:Uma2 family endonuclease, partial [Tenacibaculum finnmarkense]|nr:Uma2 family endonuclease [Tenacibaculum finnmarkense]MCG8870650.1 Uma2 family endonuclease [Tenacibaculum finnmarkense]MCG8881299.1 Uma2 family endonuclease [Tenacibaculum finnmarkense]
MEQNRAEAEQVKADLNNAKAELEQNRAEAEQVKADL